MKKTYVTSMPNHIGAFLKASKCFSSLGINIARVSYNKAVDSHTLFIDAEGTPEQLEKADTELEKIGYLQNNTNKTSIVLIEFCLEERRAIMQRLGVGQWQIFGAHGFKKDYSVNS